MAERMYDLVIFGASGFTGQFVVEEVARKTNDIPDFKWAVAGRNDVKLQTCLQEASQTTGDVTLSSTGYRYRSLYNWRKWRLFRILIISNYRRTQG